MPNTVLNILIQRYSQLIIIFFVTSFVVSIIIPLIFTSNLKTSDIENMFPICVMATFLYSVLSIPMFLILNGSVRNSKVLRAFSWVLFPIVFLILLAGGAYEAYSEEGNNALSYSAAILVIVQLTSIIIMLIRFNQDCKLTPPTP
jgi:hypothetical protein